MSVSIVAANRRSDFPEAPLSIAVEQCTGCHGSCYCFNCRYNNGIVRICTSIHVPLNRYVCIWFLPLFRLHVFLFFRCFECQNQKKSANTRAEQMRCSQNIHSNNGDDKRMEYGCRKSIHTLFSLFMIRFFVWFSATCWTFRITFNGFAWPSRWFYYSWTSFLHRVDWFLI